MTSTDKIHQWELKDQYLKGPTNKPNQSRTKRTKHTKTRQREKKGGGGRGGYDTETSFEHFPGKVPVFLAQLKGDILLPFILRNYTASRLIRHTDFAVQNRIHFSGNLDSIHLQTPM